jgi:hypothetical protein
MTEVRFKKLLLFGIAGFFFFHVSNSLIFSFPETLSSPALQKVVFRYMFPFFNQSNRVFAPDPPLFSHDLQFSLNRNGVWSPWYSILDSLNHAHYQHRFSSVSTQVKLADYQYFRIYDAILQADYQANKDESRPASARDSIRMKNFGASAAFKNSLKYLYKKKLLTDGADSMRFMALHRYPPPQDSNESMNAIRLVSPSVSLIK